MRTTLPALLALALLATPARAQSDRTALSTVPLESRVRVTADDGIRMTGRLLFADSGRVIVRGGGVAAPVSFSAASLRTVQVSRGRRRGAWTAAGALAGVAAGVVYTRAQPDESEDIGGPRKSGDGIGNALIGALIGGAAGFLFAPERWRAVHPGR